MWTRLFKFVIIFLFLIIPHLVSASAFLSDSMSSHTVSSSDPFDQFLKNFKASEMNPDDVFLNFYKGKLIDIYDEILNVNKKIARAPNEADLYYQRAVLSFKLLLLSSGFDNCYSSKFYNSKKEYYFHSKGFRNEKILRPIYDEIIQHPFCYVSESSVALNQSYVNLEVSTHHYLYNPSQDLLRAIQLNNDYQDAYLLRADFLIFDSYMGSDEDIEFFDKIIKKFPDDALAHMQRSYFKEGGYEFDACFKAQRINPKLFQSYACIASDRIDADEFCNKSIDCSPRKFPLEDAIYDREVVVEPAYGEEIHYRKFLKTQTEELQSLKPDFPDADKMVIKARAKYSNALSNFEESKCEHLLYYDDQQACREQKKHCKGEFEFCNNEEKSCYKQAEIRFETCKREANNKIETGQITDSYLKQAKLSSYLNKDLVEKDINGIKELKRIVDEAKSGTKHIDYEEFEDIVEKAVDISKRSGITKEELLFPESLILPHEKGSENDIPIGQLRNNVGDLLLTTAQVGVGVIPVIGNAISMYEFLSGKDLFTGDKLGGFERTIACLGVFVGSGKSWEKVAIELEKQLPGQLSVSFGRSADGFKEYLSKAVEVFRKSSHNGFHSEIIEADVKVILQQPPKVGQKVYRTFGKDVDKDIDSVGATPFGASWTPVNPNIMHNPRKDLGLPNANKGRFVIEGKLMNVDGVIVRPAKELDGNPGGEVEFLVPNSENYIEIERVSGVNKEF
jgi:hypothetical protein